MKNLYLLSTDKPSRLAGSEYITNVQGIDKRVFKFNFWNKIIDNKDLKDTGYIPQNMYIISDEEIREENLTKEIYVIDVQTNNIGKLSCKNSFFKGSCKLIGVEWKNKQDIWNYYHIREIILTTDLDLIKDDVQAIDNEFLKWFVKNPSCKEVEVMPIGFEDREDYLIIIPKEESKQIFSVDFEMSIDDEGMSIEVPIIKRETLEEAAERLYPIIIYDYTDTGLDLKELERQIFINGAKWMQEKSYSEEDILDAWELGAREGLPLTKKKKEKLFEKFKKKYDMSHSSPEGIILGKGSTLQSLELSIDKEKVINIKQERSYSDEEVLKIITSCKEYLSFGDEFDEIKWFEQFKKK